MTTRFKSRRGFTLAEVVIATTLTVVVMAGVTSSMLMFTKLGYRTEQYTDMENETRLCLEKFGTDTRSAKSITWNSPTSITLAVVDDDAGSSHNVTYAHDATAKTLVRTQGTEVKTLVTGVTAFAFKSFTTGNVEVPITSGTLTTAATSTRQVQLSLSARRQQSASISTEQKVVSARFILRNK